MIVTKVETKKEYVYYTMSDGKIFYFPKSHIQIGEEAYDLATGHILRSLQLEWSVEWFKSFKPSARNPYSDYINAINSYLANQSKLKNDELRIKESEKARQIYLGD